MLSDIFISDGPSFEAAGPTHRYALLNSRVSLVCGTGLDSNPQATVTWRAPDGTTIVDNDRYGLDNGPDAVRLNIVQVTMSDVGLWSCDVTVQSEKYVIDNGALVLEGRDVIGSPIHHIIQLTAVGKCSNTHSKSIMFEVEDCKVHV